LVALDLYCDYCSVRMNCKDRMNDESAPMLSSILLDLIKSKSLCTSKRIGRSELCTQDDATAVESEVIPSSVG